MVYKFGRYNELEALHGVVGGVFLENRLNIMAPMMMYDVLMLMPFIVNEQCLIRLIEM